MIKSAVLLVFIVGGVCSLRHETVKVRISQHAVDYSTLPQTPIYRGHFLSPK